ncbi:MAG: hypothetical protein G3M78_03905 [Candidatus Nitrohelix vancouverensis]|uniref:Uncharacterized protein n=1 Tax=Candidatus Nitrohelix vancouverensis TaxID=2705534 RepID=A0A7T0C101_9BACT|nr:MAG: hypothetical protein G3M78_03905 [Candidatus Nitrohelix vancouverensis]
MATGFYYPDKAAPTAQWVPTRQPLFPLSESADYPRQASAETAGGALYVQDQGVRRERFELRFSGLTEADRTAALAFFDAVKKSVRTFEYEDWRGDLHTVRWMSAFDFNTFTKDATADRCS